MKVVATGNGLNRLALIVPCRTASPRMASGRKAMNRLRTKRCCAALVGAGRPRATTDALAILPDNRQDGAGLDDDLEQLAALVVEIEQVAGEDQVAGRRDRQEFGQPFDDAENESLEEKNGIHGAQPRQGGRILLLPAGSAPPDRRASAGRARAIRRTSPARACRPGTAGWALRPAEEQATQVRHRGAGRARLPVCRAR